MRLVCAMEPRPHAVRIEPHARELRVREDQSILDAALAAGLNLPHSCKSGHCASCIARLRQGEICYPHGPPLGLSAAEAESGCILLCQAQPRSPVVVEARLIASVGEVQIKTLPCRIAGMTRLAADVLQVWLRLPAVESLPFRAGQYLDILLSGGRRRSFSIASPPHDSGLLELHVRRVPGGGFTSQLFDSLHLDDLLHIEGPIGQFVLRDTRAPLLMIAGGTGFAPLKSMLRHLLENGAGRAIHFYWGARRASDVYEDELVLGWTRRYPQLHYQAVLSAATSSGHAHHGLGWVHQTVLHNHPQLAGFDIYAAGPPALIEAVRHQFPTHGADATRLYFDSFDYAPDAAPTA
jgi:CDP-4-dehydro-6-deoxyglucose reductase